MLIFTSGSLRLPLIIFSLYYKTFSTFLKLYIESDLESSQPLFYQTLYFAVVECSFDYFLHLNSLKVFFFFPFHPSFLLFFLTYYSYCLEIPVRLLYYLVQIWVCFYLLLLLNYLLFIFPYFFCISSHYF